MTHKNERPKDPPLDEQQQPRRVRLPGFIIDEEVGLGSVIQRATTYLGIQSCGGCERRAAALNKWLVFTNRK
jgi:hypothetical protein